MIEMVGQEIQNRWTIFGFHVTRGGWRSGLHTNRFRGRAHGALAGSLRALVDCARASGRAQCGGDPAQTRLPIRERKTLPETRRRRTA